MTRLKCEECGWCVAQCTCHKENDPLPSPSFDLFFDVKSYGQLKRKYKELKNASESFDHLKEMMAEHGIEEVQMND